MKLWIGVTDKDWFEHLVRLRPDEVNFWQPSGTRSFRVLQPGEPFLFKLHSPDNFIVGGGFFVRNSALPTSLAWDAFGQKNGVGSLADLRARVRRYRREDASVDPMIGCNVLAEPFFFLRPQWIPVPSGWSGNIVQGKSYETGSADGAAIWDAVQRSMILGRSAMESDVAALQEDQRRFGAECLARGRLGQGAFRVLVTDAYERRCAVTGERTLTPEFRVEVSPRLREEWQNGKIYYAHHGQELAFRPGEASHLPAREHLEWHNQNVFKS